MKKVMALVLIGMLTVLSPTALAQPEEDTTVPETEAPVAPAVFSVDTGHVYPGMGKSYAQGYLPTVANGQATVVLPLVVSGSTYPMVTAGLDLGDPAAAPFVFENHVKDFPLETYTLEGGGEAACFLISFTLNLKADRKNGSYPVVVHVVSKAEDGTAITQDFTLYVVISDEAVEPTVPQTEAAREVASFPQAKPQPKLIVESYTLSQRPLEAGDRATLTLMVRNTSASQTVKNIKLSFEDASGDILPVKTGSAYMDKIKKEESTTCSFDIRVALNAAAKAHLVTVKMEYENTSADSFTAADTVVLDIVQPLRLEYEQPVLPVRVTEGDSVPFSMNIMNLGKGTVYNVLLTFAIPGLNNGGSVLVGNLPPGEAREANTNFLVSDRDGEYGDTRGTLLLSYEDETGEGFEKKIDLKTTIEKKVVVAAAQPSKTEEKENFFLSKWAWVLGGVAVAWVIGLLIAKQVKERKRRQLDEQRL
jgi:hypothetical protein